MTDEKVVAAPEEVAVAKPQPIGIMLNQDLFLKYAETCADRELGALLEEGVPEIIASIVFDSNPSDSHDAHCGIIDEVSNRTFSYYDEIRSCFIPDDICNFSTQEEELFYEALDSFRVSIEDLAVKELLKLLANREHDHDIMMKAIDVFIGVPVEKEKVA